MELGKIFYVTIVGFALVGCAPAPAPQPIMPEPYYDKFGNIEIPPQVCVPARQRQTPGTVNRPDLPTCESRCAPGTQLDPGQSASTHATSVRPLCVPIPSNGGNDRPTPQQTPGTTGPIN